MINEINTEFIIRTKLHRPQITEGHVHRDTLLNHLNRNLHIPSVLVSAPPGYGKSSLVSCWLRTCKLPGSWVSLDENDNDLRGFLSYVVAAIQQIFPDACSGISSMLKVAHRPPVSVLTRTLINELVQIQTGYILVLDDYHNVRDKEIHQLVTSLLNYPTASMHLVLICRRDPPLPLATLRAREQMIDIRTRDLRFSLRETKKMLQQIVGVPVDNDVVAILDDKIEGWAIGLRLTALAMRNRKDWKNQLTDLPTENHYAMDYVVNEILSLQPRAVQECLLRCSIFNRFCAPLCQALCSLDKDSTVVPNGEKLIDILDKDKIFVISLDDDSEWFRFHHLFKALLKRQYKKRFSIEYIANVHKLASTWFSENGYVEEALAHAFESGDNEFSAQLVKKHRLDIINREQWLHLDYWLQKFPAGFIENDRELLLAKAWVYQRQARYSKLFEILGEIEKFETLNNREQATGFPPDGEIKVLKSFQYFATGEGKSAEKEALEALQCLPLDFHSGRGFAVTLLALALQMQGSLSQGNDAVYTAMQENEASNPVYRTMLLVSLCFMGWISVDSKKMKPAAVQLEKHGKKNNLPETIYVGRFFSGILSYQQNDLGLAEQFLSPFANPPNLGEGTIPSIVTYCHGSFALASTYQALAKSQEASEVLDSVIGYMLESGNADLLKFCLAFQADLALRAGDVPQAELWARDYVQGQLTSAYRFYSVDLTLPRVLLALRTPESLNEADWHLVRLYEYNVSTCNTRMLIHILALQALLNAAKGDRVMALRKLTEGLGVAEPGKFIRPFLDEGQEMVDLLASLIQQNPTFSYARHVYEHFGVKQDAIFNRRREDRNCIGQPSRAEHLATPLTNREIEVFRILTKGVSNKEIAKTMYISPETVKRHLSTIYRKLQVKNRHQAILSGKSLGIL